MRMLFLLLIGLLACEAAPPVACNPTLPGLTVHIGDEVTVEPCFETEELPLRYSVESSNPRIMMGVSEHGTRILGVGVGEAIATIKATNPNDLSAFQSLHVTVPNRLPSVMGMKRSMYRYGT